MKQQFWNSRINSFRYAINGILIASGETNFRIQFLMALLATALGLYFHISNPEWLALLLCFGMVLTAEAINTAIEEMVDYISKERSQAAGRIKDIAAGAVLIAAFFSAVIGAVIFIPRILSKLNF